MLHNNNNNNNGMDLDMDTFVMSTVTELEDDNLINIFEFLDQKTVLTTVRPLCSSMYQLINSNQNWNRRLFLVTRRNRQMMQLVGKICHPAHVHISWNHTDDFKKVLTDNIMPLGSGLRTLSLELVTLNLEQLPLLFKHCPNLESLKMKVVLMATTNTTYHNVCRRPSRLPSAISVDAPLPLQFENNQTTSLKHITFIDCLDSVTLETIIRASPDLQSISISNSYSTPTPTLWESLLSVPSNATRNNNLQSLNLYNCEAEDDRIIEQIVRHLSPKNLVLQGCCRQPRKILGTLSTMGFIETLSVSNLPTYQISSIEDQAPAIQPRSWSCLTSLELKDFGVSDIELIMAHAPSLQTLVINRVRDYEDKVSHLSKQFMSSNLRKIEFLAADFVFLMQILEKLPYSSNVEEIVCTSSYTSIDLEQMQKLTKYAPSLTCLTLESVNVSVSEAHFWSLLSSLKHLRRVHLRNVTHKAATNSEEPTPKYVMRNLRSLKFASMTMDFSVLETLVASSPKMDDLRFAVIWEPNQEKQKQLKKRVHNNVANL